VSVIVVEGIFDCVKVHQAGMPSVVALMGAVLYEPQCRALLGRFRNVILMLDGDIAGQRAATSIAVKLQPRRPVRVVELPAGQQPDQLSMQEIREILTPETQRRLALR